MPVKTQTDCNQIRDLAKGDVYISGLNLDAPEIKSVNEAKLK